MPIAAVPAYLREPAEREALEKNKSQKSTDKKSLPFEEASPALRFGMLLPIWTKREDQENEVNERAGKKSPEAKKIKALLDSQGMNATIAALCQAQRNPLPGLWDKNDHGANVAWQNIIALNALDKERMEALGKRQQHLAALPPFSAHMLTLCATAIAPFTTGLGNEHPLENGFAFLSPYGLPYLAGSGVKGVLRQATRELAEGRWGDTRGWSNENINILFGHETESDELIRGVLDFWDVIPQIPGKELAVEVMTPHQGHYYQPKPKDKKDKEDKNAGKSTSPHDSGQPTPITFLTVPPGSAMNFYVRCDEARLATLAQELMEKTENGEPRWKTLLTAAFEHAFEWLGFGAKTSVGYGAMQRDTKKEEEQLKAAKAQRDADEEAKKEQARQEAKKQLSPAMQQVSDFESACEKYKKKIGNTFERIQKGSGFYPVAKRLRDAAAQSNWSAEEKAAAKAAIERWLPEIFGAKSAKDARKELKLGALAPAA